MFATAKGNVRRNALSDFSSIHATGKIAMKFEGEDADDRLIAAAICTDKDDILLATRNGRSIRFPIEDNVRLFSSRNSVGVRGIRLIGEGDAVISLSVLRHEDSPPELLDAYLRLANERRRNGHDNGSDENGGTNGGDIDDTEDEAANVVVSITEEQYAEFAAREEFVLTITEKGFGRRTSSYEYRIKGRGGQGQLNVPQRHRESGVPFPQGKAVAVFAVVTSDQIMLVTNGGVVIRVPVDGISIRRRGSGGVVMFKVDDGERVVSAARFPEAGESVVDGTSEGTEA